MSSFEIYYRVCFNYDEIAIFRIKSKEKIFKKKAFEKALISNLKAIQKLFNSKSSLFNYTRTIQLFSIAFINITLTHSHFARLFKKKPYKFSFNVFI